MKRGLKCVCRAATLVPRSPTPIQRYGCTDYDRFSRLRTLALHDLRKITGEDRRSRGSGSTRVALRPDGCPGKTEAIFQVIPDFPIAPRIIEPGLICAFLGLLFLFCFIAYAGAQEGQPYEVVINGIDERSFRMDLESSLATFELKARPLPTVNLLRYRTEEDLLLIVKALRARGYYAATAAVDIDESAHPLLVTFRVETGHLIVFSAVDIILIDADAAKQEVKLPAVDQLGLKEGDPAKARTILDAEEKLLTRVAAEGFPFSRVVDRRVAVDRATRQVAVTVKLQPGPFAHFGTTEITGLESVDGDFVLRIVPWQKRQVFDGELLPRFQQKLIETGLFAIIRVTTGEQLDKDDLLPISVEFSERKQRTVKAGLRYSTDEGIGGKLSWEHHNLFRHGERAVVAGGGGFPGRAGPPGSFL